MALLLPTWTFLTAVIALTAQPCAGESSCGIRSTAGSVVQLGSSFEIYCTFKCQCKKFMCHPPTLKGQELNSTTVYFNVANITRNQTYSCQCDCRDAPDSCGMDVYTGYIPALPSNISCVYSIRTNENRTVMCTWNRGRDTYLNTDSFLWVRTPSGNSSAAPVSYGVSSQGDGSLSSSLALSTSVQQISVWVESHNGLGVVRSAPVSFTLSDIVRPSAPDLRPPVCSSRECVVNVTQSLRTEALEMRYRPEAGAWTLLPDSGRQDALAQARSISSLQPYRLYHFQARARFRTGLWSPWSASVSSWTQEEAPAGEPDVWCAEADVKSLRVYWKEEDLSVSRGKITHYEVSVHSLDSGPVLSTNVSADARNHTVPFGAGCGVTVRSCTSQGCSPPARIGPRYAEAKTQLRVAHEITGKRGAAIWWEKADAAARRARYVVEWYPEGQRLDKLQWSRLGRNESRALITGLEPLECYTVAVHAVLGDDSVAGTGFAGIATSESAPGPVPSVLETVEGRSARVSWKQVPRGQRGGCITNYTVYLENSGWKRRVFSVAASETTLVIEDLPPDAYTLWVTASTAMGEGPRGQGSEVRFFIQQETVQTLVLVAIVVSMSALLLVCLYQNSVVKQRVLGLLRCLLPDKVPDPANSKWARECVLQRGTMRLQLQTSTSSATEEEEEPVLVEVEELPRQRRDSSHTLLSSASRADPLLYPPTAYIKSLSHDSDGSKQTSLDTNTTVDYISAHNPDQDQEEEDDEFPEMIGFFPSHDFEPLGCGGKLTLDAVKINCGEFSFNF